jgi:DNA-binding NarL/FixJ family response regulator
MTTPDASVPTIVVKHAEPIFAAGLTASLRGISGFQVVAEPDSSARDPRSRIVVCDYETSRRMAHGLADGGMVVVARKPRDFEIQDAMARGVLGYVAAGCSLGELENAVRAAAAGSRFLCQAAAREIANGLTNESLTTRERDVLLLLAQGSCNKSIANRLDIALGTVKAHVRAIMAKLKASSRTEAASIAVSRGLLPERGADDLHGDRRRPAGAWASQPIGDHAMKAAPLCA